MGLWFERVEIPDGYVKWNEVSSPNFQRVVAREGKINMAGDMEIESPADLAELFRVLREAAEVAGWEVEK